MLEDHLACSTTVSPLYSSTIVWISLDTAVRIVYLYIHSHSLSVDGLFSTGVWARVTGNIYNTQAETHDSDPRAKAFCVRFPYVLC